MVKDEVLVLLAAFWSDEPFGKLEVAVKLWAAILRFELVGKVIVVEAPLAKLPVQAKVEAVPPS